MNHNGSLYVIANELYINQILTFDSHFFNKFKEIVSDCSKITTLNFYRCRCVESEYETLSSFISLFSLEKIVIDWCDFDISRLCGAFGQTPSLDFCRSFEFDQTHYDNFCKFFETQKSIKILFLHVGFERGLHNFPQRLIEALSKSGLESITVFWKSPPNNEYIGKHLFHIGKLIETLPTLKQFGLVETVLLSAKIDDLCQSISKSSLRYVNFLKLRLDSNNFRILFDAITNSSITHCTMTPKVDKDNHPSFQKMVKRLKGITLHDFTMDEWYATSLLITSKC